MKNRKGDFTFKQFIGAVIAIIGIVILAMLGVKLYNLLVDQDMKNAKSFINGLNAKIENLGDGNDNTFDLQGVQGWVLVGWNKNVPIVDDGEVIDKDKKPQKCFDKSCLCLCEKEVANCGVNGYCREIDRSISVFSSGELEYNLYGQTVSEKFSADCLFFDRSNLMEILVEKNKDIIKISHDYGLLNSAAGRELLSKLKCGASKDIRYIN